MSVNNIRIFKKSVLIDPIMEELSTVIYTANLGSNALERPDFGKVVLTGPDCTEVSIGDRVLLPVGKMKRLDVSDGIRYVLCDEIDIPAIVDGE